MTASTLVRRIASGEQVRIGEAALDHLEGATLDRSPVGPEIAALLGREQGTVGDCARAILAFARDGLPLRPINEPHNAINRGKAAELERIST